MYTKIIDGIKVTAPRVLVIDGMQVINPTATHYEQAGYVWEEPEITVEEQYKEAPTNEELASAIDSILTEIIPLMMV